MKKQIISTITGIITAATIFGTIPGTQISAKSSNDNTEAVNSLYEQLVVEGKNTATFTSISCGDDNWEEVIDDIFVELYAIDDPKTPYDGSALMGRGTWHIKAKGDVYTVIYEDAYDINEAQEVITEIIDEELSDRVTETTTNREKVYIICDYISRNYSYDFENLLVRNFKDVERPTFVDAYYGEHKMVCNGFATLAYLLATELGVNSYIISTDEHQYMIAQTGDSGEYVAYDLTKGKYASLSILDFTFDLQGMFIATEYDEIMTNEKHPYSYASILEPYRQLWYYILHGQATTLGHFTPLAYPLLFGIIIYVISTLFTPRRKRSRKTTSKRKPYSRHPQTSLNVKEYLK